jgi:hypothetical protein
MAIVRNERIYTKLILQALFTYKYRPNIPIDLIAHAAKYTEVWLGMDIDKSGGGGTR